MFHKNSIAKPIFLALSLLLLFLFLFIPLYKDYKRNTFHKMQIISHLGPGRRTCYTIDDYKSLNKLQKQLSKATKSKSEKGCIFGEIVLFYDNKQDTLLADFDSDSKELRLIAEYIQYTFDQSTSLSILGLFKNDSAK